MQCRLVTAVLQHEVLPCNRSTRGCVLLASDTHTALPLPRILSANRLTALHPSEEQGCLRSHSTTPGPPAALGHHHKHCSRVSAPLPALHWIHLCSSLESWHSPAACSRQQPCSRLWDALGFLPFTKIGVMEDDPPASKLRAGRHSALSPRSNLSACPRGQSFLSLLPSLPVANNHPLASVVLAAETDLLDWCHVNLCKAKPISLPDEEDADVPSSVLTNPSVSLLFSSLDMLMAVI